MADQVTSTPRIIRRKQVQAQTGLSRSSIYQAVSEGRFPKPIRLGRRSVGWVEAEICEWVTKRIEASRDMTR